MPEPARRITFGWGAHIDALLLAEELIVPQITARLRVARPAPPADGADDATAADAGGGGGTGGAGHLGAGRGLPVVHADLAPGCAYTLIPRFHAMHVQDLIADDLPLVHDALLLGFDLRLWKGRQPLEVYGHDPSICLAIRTPVAIDASGRLRSIVLGQPFFAHAACHLDRSGPSYAELL